MKRFSDMIEKSAVQQELDGIVKSRFKIAKSDDDKMLAFANTRVNFSTIVQLITSTYKVNYTYSLP